MTQPRIERCRRCGEERWAGLAQFCARCMAEMADERRISAGLDYRCPACGERTTYHDTDRALLCPNPDCPEAGPEPAVLMREGKPDA